MILQEETEETKDEEIMQNSSFTRKMNEHRPNFSMQPIESQLPLLPPVKIISVFRIKRLRRVWRLRRHPWSVVRGRAWGRARRCSSSVHLQIMTRRTSGQTKDGPQAQTMDSGAAAKSTKDEGPRTAAQRQTKDGRAAATTNNG